MSPQACAEVMEVLKYIPVDEYNKISSARINQIYQNADENSKFSYNMALSFAEQNVSQEAKGILADLLDLDQ